MNGLYLRGQRFAQRFNYGWRHDPAPAAAIALQFRARIARRIDRMKRGNFGDHKAVGDGVSEMRIDVGPGYRAYYVERERVRIILLCGGDKDDQQRNIKRAKELAEEV